MEHDPRVQVPQAAGLDRVVGGFEHHDEVGVEPVPLEEGRQRALARGQLLAAEEEVAERRVRAGELDHDRDTTLHVGGAEPDDPAVLDTAWEVLLRGHGVVMAGEHHAPGVEEDGVVVVVRRCRHQRAHVVDDPRLGAADRGNVDELQRACREGVHMRILAIRGIILA